MIEMKGRLVLAVLEILTGKVVVSSYAEMPKEKPILSVNPFKERLEFVVVMNDKLSFYRVTSIQTLETQ